MRRIFMAAGIVAVVSAIAPAMAQDAAGLSARLDATLADFHARYGFPGDDAGWGRVGTAVAGEGAGGAFRWRQSAF